jgi:hypothetical protein
MGIILLFVLTADTIDSLHQASSLHHGISSRVSTSRNFPEVLSRVAELITSMILLALSALEVSGKSMPAPVAAAIPMSVKTKLYEVKQMSVLFSTLVEIPRNLGATYPG